MKAAVIARYGSPGVIEVRDVPAPIPGPDEVLVRVHAATVNRTDCGELLHPTLIRLLTGGGRSRRTILGLDFAGTVEAVGAVVRLFKPGDRVFGMCPLRKEGAQAEYLSMSETGAIAHMPSNLRFDQAVVCEGAYYALSLHPSTVVSREDALDVDGVGARLLTVCRARGRGTRR